ncbi:hypothetical protein AALC25_06295 [Lachnospiraceae bacterium 29-84]
MLDEERIRLMTKMASYEEREGKEYMPIKQYYKKDYVGLHMIFTFFSSTVCFGILVLFWIIYKMEDLTELLNNGNWYSLGSSVLVNYLVFIAIYQLIAYIVYSRRYKKAASSVKDYYTFLKKVQRLREKEEKAQP